MNKTKILFFLPHLKAGGAERVVSFIFKSLDRTVFDPKLVVLGFKKDNHYSVPDKNVIYLNKARLRNAFFAIIKTIITEKPDLVFSSIGHINIYLGFLKSFFPKVKFIAREASVYSKMSAYNHKKELPFFLLKKCYHNLDALIYQSKDMKHDFEQTFGIPSKNGILIHNPISFTPNTTRSSALNFQTPVVFIIVGSLVINKGHKRVLDLFEKVNFDFVLEIIGDGPLMEELKEKLKNSKIKDKVIFKGIQKDMEVIYASANFLIQGSYVEGFPNVVLEALSFGVPCVVFNTPGGHREMIIENKNGCIVKNEDEGPLIMEKIIHHHWDSLSIQKDAFARFGADKIIKQYETMFLKIHKQ
ncbi:MAG: glycosyltransferase [Flavobacteriaceae bacterium]